MFSIGAYAQVVVIDLGGDDIKGLNFAGPQPSLPQKTAEAAGWSICHSEDFNTDTTLVSDVLAKCDKPELMLACRPKSNPVFLVAAHAHRTSVTHDTGNAESSTVTHRANGTEWYFNDQYSWGFAPAGNPVRNNSCDLEADNSAQRMCIHITAGNLAFGHRCGNIRNPASFDRVFLHRLVMRDR